MGQQGVRRTGKGTWRPEEPEDKAAPSPGRACRRNYGPLADKTQAGNESRRAKCLSLPTTPSTAPHPRLLHFTITTGAPSRPPQGEDTVTFTKKPPCQSTTVQ
ncbi:hypothetical protein AAFF_G00332160 [Aldrovandia affinis]|uniref:Uncharacterized protein n=1 Tax=Aldrovandia affinis TaxID=143900 RepID=A0AAD7SLF3_9TELE|nr:hypothetical protein AAFF_G00332160 [Aldrovandia affinis]